MRSLSKTFIPLVRTKTDYEVATSVMGRADLIRLPADILGELRPDPKTRFWIDTGFDGFEHIFGGGGETSSKATSGWHRWIRTFSGTDAFSSEADAKSASDAQVRGVVNAVLDQVTQAGAAAVSVPQVPYSTSSSRHAINRRLASAAGEWKERHWPTGQLVLPVVLTRSDAYRTSAARRARIPAVLRALEASRASAIWVAHAEFDDLGGQGNLERQRFPELISFHEQLNESLPSGIARCGGPYWALNLILWARNLIDIPVIGCGGSYKYYSPKPPQLFGKQKGAPRIALPLLRRCYPASIQLKGWIASAKSKFDKGTDQWAELSRLDGGFHQFLGTAGRSPAKRQAAEFYVQWIDSVMAVHPHGRALFLFQDFSKAVVNGSHIGVRLPKHSGLSGDARDPGFVAQQFMLQCLPR